MTTKRLIVKTIEKPHSDHDFQLFGTRPSGALVYYCIYGGACGAYMVVCPNHGDSHKGGWWNICTLVINKRAPEMYYCSSCKVTV